MPRRLRAFFVHPDAARQGMARMLIALCERTAAAVGLHAARTAHNPRRPAALPACGFADVERMTNIFPNCVAALVYRMAKAIGPESLSFPAGVASSDPYPTHTSAGVPRPPSLN